MTDIFTTLTSSEVTTIANSISYNLKSNLYTSRVRGHLLFQGADYIYAYIDIAGRKPFRDTFGMSEFYFKQILLGHVKVSVNLTKRILQYIYFIACKSLDVKNRAGLARD